MFSREESSLFSSIKNNKKLGSVLFWQLIFSDIFLVPCWMSDYLVLFTEAALVASPGFVGRVYGLQQPSSALQFAFIVHRCFGCKFEHCPETSFGPAAFSSRNRPSPNSFVVL